MKTKLILFVALVLCGTSCRRPTFPKPGEPTLSVNFVQQAPGLQLPWKVMKGKRLACDQPWTYTTDFSAKKGSLKKS